MKFGIRETFNYKEKTHASCACLLICFHIYVNHHESFRYHTPLTELLTPFIIIMFVITLLIQTCGSPTLRAFHVLSGMNNFVVNDALYITLTHDDIDGLVQEYNIINASEMHILQSFTESSINSAQMNNQINALTSNTILPVLALEGGHHLSNSYAVDT